MGSIPASKSPQPASESSRSSPGSPRDSDEYQQAMDHAALLLTYRPRSTKEMGDRLRETGFEASVVDRVVQRLLELGLLDDLVFARQWISERARRRGLAPRALVFELEARGVDADLAAAALAEEGIDETDQAIEVATAYVDRIAHLPLDRQAGRVHAMLMRKGFCEEAAQAATRAVLPPEGWD